MAENEYRVSLIVCAKNCGKTISMGYGFDSLTTRLNRWSIAYMGEAVVIDRYVGVLLHSPVPI